ncbi:retrovirus-related Pol polyprotein from transposon 412 [Trichonephila clavipes]|uniref:Retrovirus-related Pol polyprotein from transposon 412 n=1 Tax=Trichonephila clavipes TaxID=2585209 RepID=A0A8X6SW84_TRICX|nr:retrovirus-related Pol polyprotein from transposon 412 [Trichonephila clavipes]
MEMPTPFREDRVLRAANTARESKRTLAWKDIAPFHPTTKRYWALWDTLHLRNGVLYQKWECDDGNTFRWQLILPKIRVSTVLKELHGSSTGGHFGVIKTLQKVRPRKRTRGRLQLYTVGQPFERIVFHILGPLPRSSDGNNNILVVMDYFTKWPEAYILFPTMRTQLLQRSAVYETTGYSPSHMLFGLDLRLPADLLFSQPPDAPLVPEEYIEKLQIRMEEMHHLARERIGMTSEKMKTRYDLHEDDKLWLWNPKRRKGLSQ